MEQKIQEIINYIFNDMSNEEKLNFERQLSESSELQYYVKETQILLVGIERNGDMQLKTQLLSIEGELEKEGFFYNRLNENNNTKLIQFPKLKWTIGIAASILLFFGWMLIQYNSSVKNITEIVQHQDKTNQGNSSTLEYKKTQIDSTIYEKEKKDIKSNIDEQYVILIEKNYQIPQFTSTRGNGYDGILDSCYKLIRTKKYQQALILLQLNENQLSKEQQAQWVKAHLLLQTKQYDKSRLIFEKLSTQRNSPFAEQSDYYLLLCYLNHFEKNKTLINQLFESVENDIEHIDYERIMAIKKQL